MDSPTPQEIEDLRQKAVAFYETRDALERTYFYPVLDANPTLADLEGVLAVVESKSTAFEWSSPLPLEPDYVVSQQLFASIEFECRRRRRALTALSN